MVNRQTATRHEAFLRQVDNWVLECGPGCRSFDDLLSKLPGVYPTVALESIRRLAAAGEFDMGEAQALDQDATMIAFPPAVARPELPLPHPVDFEWRFHPSSSRYLLDLSCTLAGPGKPLLLLGTPGVAYEAIALGMDRPLTFVGEDNSVARCLAGLNRASGAPLNMRSCTAAATKTLANVVIMDPPWYMDFLRPMLEQAAAATRLSGFILISLPPAGARPSAAQDRRKVIRFAARIGLEAVAHQELALSYDTPFFEANALSAENLRAPHAWRRSDLIVFRKVSGTNGPVFAPHSSKPRWLEVEIDRMRMFVRLDRPANGLRGLIPLIEGDILPAVSRRDPRRRQAMVWTSGNRIFATDNPQLVIEAARGLAGVPESSGVSPLLCGTIAQREAADRVGVLLQTLAAQEATEERALQPTETRIGVARGRRGRRTVEADRWSRLLAQVPERGQLPLQSRRHTPRNLF